jgi:DNA-binding Lrp family transcriptional regulator
MSDLTDTDRELLRALRANPRATITELARDLRAARGTMYARLERLERSGVITGWGPDIDPRAAGFGVLGFVTLEIDQAAHADAMEHLRAVPELLQIHTITGAGDLLCVAIATSNDHMHEALQRITAHPAVHRSQTQLALHTDAIRSPVDVVTAEGSQ